MNTSSHKEPYGRAYVGGGDGRVRTQGTVWAYVREWGMEVSGYKGPYRRTYVGGEWTPRVTRDLMGVRT